VKGIVFNLLETVVQREFGEEKWDQLLEAAGLEGAYTSVGSYDDADMIKLVQAASGALDLPPDAILRWFGRKAMPILAKTYPHFFGPYQNTRSFLLTLNSIIHPEVRKIYPGADVPEFDFSSSSDDELTMGYRSRRKLCALAEGFIEGAADHFAERVGFDHSKCMHRGDEKCVIEMKFQKA
jgi:hypothetical protein